MKHNSQAFFADLKALQDRYLVNISAQADRVIFDFADDPRLMTVKGKVWENGKWVVKDVIVLR